MPLPAGSVQWPPTQLTQVGPKLNEWSAWWTGDPAQLTKTYQRTQAQALPNDRPSQRRGGVVGALARFWWGRPATDLTQTHDQTHVPLAADIARTSADLLFAEPPTVTVTDTATQTHLERALSDTTFATLTGAAEAGAALGGVYLKVSFDRTIADQAFITVTPADEAVPEFSWDRLRAVTFWHQVAESGSTVWRHLERHELDQAGVGLVQHGLYAGSPDKLGRPVPLQDHPATAPLAASVDKLGYITEGRTRGLAVVYVPNTLPITAKAWRRVPTAEGLGASDFDGVEPLLDNFDEIHASWMRDIRLGKGRILIARHMLESNGPGRGASFDLDQEVFAALNIPDPEEGTAPITLVQFKIRFEEHAATAQAWLERIIRDAGYSTSTFGDTDPGVAEQTATEVIARQNRSMLTRSRKLCLWRPALTEIITKLITVDADVFRTPGNPEGLDVAFPDGVTESPLQTAQTVQALSVAQAASTRTLVAMTHPDWDEKQVNDEADLITGERGTPVTDPFTLGQ